MSVCPHCQISGRRSNSRISVNILENCAKNRTGSCGACEKLRSVDRKIEDTRRILNDLLDEREGLASLLNDHHDPFSSRIPVELASKVLWHSLPDFDGNVIPDGTSWARAVLLTGQGCKKWRKISQTTPQLWAVIPIRLDKTNCISSITIAQEWLRRSANLPLHLRMDLPTQDEDISVFTRKLLSCVVLSAHRWEIVELNIPYASLRFLSESLLNQDLPLLKVVKCFTIYNGAPTNPEVCPFNASPETLIQLGARHSQISVRVDRLVSFKADFSIYIYIEDCIQLFVDAIHLSTCTIDAVVGSRPVGLPVRAASLQNLHIDEIGSNNFWDHFEFPRLESLRLGHDHDSWRSLSTLIRRSSCVIKVLDLSLDQRSQHEVMGLLELTPGLQQLRLDDPLILEPFFSLLDAATSRPSSCFLTKLVSFTCTLYSRDFDWKPLLLFLTTMTSRPERTLQTFKFYYKDHDDEYSMSKPMPSSVIRLLMDATCDMEEVQVFTVDGEDVVAEYRAGRY